MRHLGARGQVKVKVKLPILLHSIWILLNSIRSPFLTVFIFRYLKFSITPHFWEFYNFLNLDKFTGLLMENFSRPRPTQRTRQCLPGN